ncbi:MAG: pyridoxal phosphate-dependent aminotransferase [Candidatus Korarchaeota archaeon]|nr:pyridoxal phosphate-dependent aminotransferase [Candidatus Korarchaeota archaeon]
MLTIRDIFDACNRKAARGMRVIGAHIGAPSHDPPLPVSEVLSETGEVGRNYLPFTGMDEARDAVVDFASRFLRRDYERDRVFMTNGGAQALLISSLTSWKLKKGKILIPAPGFIQYFEHPVEFSYPVETYNPLAEDLVNEVLGRIDGAGAVLINFPNNPTGHLPPNSALRDLWDELRRRNVLLLNDAAYSQIYFGERVEIVGDVVIDTFSKTFSLPGMRAGYIYWGAEGRELVGRLIYLTTAGVSEVVQRLVMRMIEAASDRYFEGVREHYRRMRDALVREASKAGLEFVEPRGAFYLYARHPEVEDSEELALKLLDSDPVVGIVPAAAFRGGKEWFRVSYGRLREEEMAELMEAIGRAAGR